MTARTETFLAAVSGDTGALVVTDLDSRLERACATARAELPQVAGPEESFLRFLAQRVEAGKDPAAAFETLNLPDLYLACGCVLKIPAALTEFTERYLNRVGRYLTRLNPDPNLADEVRQELSRKLLVAAPPEPARIAGYNGRGSLDAWVAVSAQRMALTLLQREQRAGIPVAGDQLERALAESNNPELMLAKTHLKAAFEQAIRTALGKLSSRDRTLLRLTVVSGVGCRQLGTMYGVHSATMARWIGKIREDLFESIQGVLRQQQGIEPSEIVSLLGFARSQIDLSLAGLMVHDDPPA